MTNPDKIFWFLEAVSAASPHRMKVIHMPGSTDVILDSLHRYTINRPQNGKSLGNLFSQSDALEKIQKVVGEQRYKGYGFVSGGNEPLMGYERVTDMSSIAPMQRDTDYVWVIVSSKLFRELCISEVYI